MNQENVRRRSAPIGVSSRLPRTPLAVAQDVLLILYCAVTAAAHAALLLDGHFVSIGFFAEQSLLVGMFLVRRRPIATSTRPWDWIIAIGAWLSLAMRPIGTGNEFLALAGGSLQFVGFGLTVVAFLYLGKSFGIVAANRGLKVNGPYRLVRHPIYFAHTVTSTGFLIANPSAFNFAVLAIITICQVLRMHAEERVLIEGTDYSAYAAQVRWRMVPGLY
jgi:protein-S-isoprenylcysteine O-methyltransferase Ste14